MFWNFYFRRKLLWQDSCNCKLSPGGRRNTEMGHWDIVRESTASLGRAKEGGTSRSMERKLLILMCLDHWEWTNFFPKFQDKTIAINHEKSSKYSCQLFSVPVINVLISGKHSTPAWAPVLVSKFTEVCLSCVPNMNPIPDSHYIGHWWCYHPILVINILVDI